jgi:hypothetical protein
MTEPEGQEPEVKEPKTFDEGYVKELRNEAAGYRVERNELKKQVETLAEQVKGFEDANKSELEKAQAKAVEAERLLAEKDREIAETSLRASVMAAAAHINIVDADAAYKLLDLSALDPEDPKSIAKALTELVKDKPFLVKAPPNPGIGQKPVQGAKTTPELWVDMLKKGAT